MSARDDGILTDATQSPVPSKQETELDKAISWAVDTLKAATVTVFSDALGELHVHMPNDHQHKIHRFNSPRLGAWLAAQYFKEKRTALPDQVVGYIKKILEDEAWHAPSLLPIEPRTWELLERSPVGMAVIAHLNTNGNYSGRTVEFYKLVKPPVQQGFTANKFPVNTQVFSRRLKDLIPLFKVIGIEIVVMHKEDGGHCSIEIKDTNLFYPEPDGNLVSPSGTPSGSKARETKTLRKPDEPDAILGPQELPAEQHRQLLAAINSVKGEKS